MIFIVSIIDLTSLIVIIIGFAFFITDSNHIYSKQVKILFLILLGLIIFHHFSNVLEWSEITASFDPFEDYLGILEPLFLFFFIYALLQEQTKNKLLESEKKYRNAFEKAGFYKDILAHDISNILQNILSANDLGTIERSDDLNQLITNQVLRGARLIKNIRNLSQLEEELLFLHNTNLLDVLNKSIALVKDSHLDKNVQIQIEFKDKELNVYADNFLSDVFENILYNSIKYCINPIVQIFIRISKIHQDEKPYIKLEFIDNGEGIPEEKKAFLFTRDFPKKKSSSGFGLGLYLVHKIIESYKGIIWIENKDPKDYSKGTKVVILLPEVIE